MLRLDRHLLDAVRDHTASVYIYEWAPPDAQRDPPLPGEEIWQSLRNRLLVWHDPVADKTWQLRSGAYVVKDGAKLPAYPAHLCQVYVSRHDNSDFTPVVVNDHVDDSSSSKNPTCTLGVDGRFPLSASFVEAGTSRPVGGVGVVLHRRDGLILGTPWANSLRITDDTGELRYRYLDPGEYWIEARRDALWYGDPDYTPEPARIPVKVEAVENHLTVPLRPVQPHPSEAQQRWGFVIQGVVRDGNGRPLPGVEVAAARFQFINSAAQAAEEIRWAEYPVLLRSPGKGESWTNERGESLTCVGHTRSEADGSYVLRFSPEAPCWISGPPARYAVGTHCLGVFARRPGYAEQNLCRQGRCIATGLADRLTTRQKAERIIEAGQPAKMDFVMVPAVSIQGTLARAQNSPRIHALSLAIDKTMWIQGLSVGPDGAFQLADVPCGEVIFVGLDQTVRGSQDLGSIQLSRPGEYHIEVRQGGRGGIAQPKILSYTAVDTQSAESRDTPSRP